MTRTRSPYVVWRIAGVIQFIAILAVGGCGNHPPSSASRSATTAASVSTSAPAGDIHVAGAAVMFQPAPQADALMRTGAGAYARGDFGWAASMFEKAGRLYGEAGRNADRCDALLDLALAYQSLGSFKEAANELVTAFPLAQQMHDRGREIDLLDGLGTVYTFTRNYSDAEIAIKQGMTLAENSHNEIAIARLLNNRGNLLAAQANYESAGKSYEEAADRARKAGDSITHARAMTNQALALVREGKTAEAVEVGRKAGSVVAALPDGHEKANLLITIGRTLWQAHGELNAQEADQALDLAAKVADAVHDYLSLSFALGYRGAIAEEQKRYADALALTRRAEFLAQEMQSADAMYRWEWQIARLLRDQGHISDAINQYDAAIKTLQKIHGDLANGYGNQSAGGSFRETVGPIYFQMADLLLRRADSARDDSVQELLTRATHTVELLKSSELDDYFQQKCVNLLQEASIQQKPEKGVAVVYLIPLMDRTEMVVSTPAGMERFKSPVGAEELTAEVREFRMRLEDRTSNRFLTNARRIYDWIIRPMEPALRAGKIDTLIFVPDGALRTIPMAALNDGKEFLIAKYAVGITPGLTLMKSSGAQGAKVVLEGGLSVSKVTGFAPLDYVPQELSSVKGIWGGMELLNQNFTAANLKSEMDQQDFTYVHLASHAEFSHNERDTFLLTYDKKLSLEGLKQLIQRHKFSDQPLELLTLSACQTAAGDDRAALGLAGVAIAMGARSAVATLWSVNDQASAELIRDFYTELQSTTKVKAMQRAQIEMLHDPRYRHPCYWAPYLVIGNWD